MKLKFEIELDMDYNCTDDIIDCIAEDIPCAVVDAVENIIGDVVTSCTVQRKDTV